MPATLSDAGDSDPEDCRLPLPDHDLFPCDMCSNLYTTAIVLAGHKLRRHSDEIPDLAVIESLKRQWRNRYDPEHIKHQQSVLQQLGPIDEERVKAGLKPVCTRNTSSKTKHPSPD